MDFMSLESPMAIMNFDYFSFFDGEQIVVLFNCFRKKSQKTPKKEINKALKLKGEYYEQKG